MTPAEFLRALREHPASHFYAVTPDVDGMVLLIPKILKALAHERDVRVLDAASVTVGHARDMARSTGMAPVGGSERTHFVVWRAHLLKPGAAAALLLAVEEAPRGRFVFVAGRSPRGALRPLASRCTKVALPFLSKRAVLGNLQALRLDAHAAAEKDLWDGTLGGTAANIREAKERGQILDALSHGMQGLADLVAYTDSPAFDRVLAEHMNEEERDFLERESSPERRKLVAFHMLARRNT